MKTSRGRKKRIKWKSFLQYAPFLELIIFISLISCLFIFGSSGLLCLKTNSFSERVSDGEINESALSLTRELSERIVSEREENILKKYSSPGIVLCDNFVYMRDTPYDNSSDNIIGILPTGAAVDIIAEDSPGDGYIHISSGGMTGYIKAEYLRTGSEAIDIMKALICPVVRAIDEVVIYENPVSQSRVLGKMSVGEIYRIVSRNNEWIKIQADNNDFFDYAYINCFSGGFEAEYGINEGKKSDLGKALNKYGNLGLSLARDYINIRKEPCEDGINNIVGKLPGSAGCDIIGEDNGWLKIVSANVTGYVKKEYILTGDEAYKEALEKEILTATVNTPSLNVRSGPSTSFKIWTRITEGQTYEVINILDGWVQIDLGTGDDDIDEEAYVSTRDKNVKVGYSLEEAVEYFPAIERKNQQEALRSRIVNYACQFVGNRYVWGGVSLTNGCDCSGFTLSVMKKFGISLPRVSRDQAKSGVRVNSGKMRPGDLVFYANKSGIINHVGIYIGNGQVVNAASKKSGIRIYRWNYRTPVAIRNVLGD